MPAGWDVYGATIRVDGPAAWYRFAELGSSIASGGQNSQLLCFDSSASGNLNPGVIPNPNGNSMQYGSGVTYNGPSIVATLAGSNYNGSANFPSTATLSLTNIATMGSLQPPILQPSASVSMGGWCQPNVAVASATQVLACYGSDAAATAAYKLYHTGTSTTNHVFAFAVNVAGTVRTATAAGPNIITGTPYYVVGVYNGTAVQIWVNGVLQGSTAITGAISYAGIGAFGLAAGNDPSLTDANLQGALDELAIYTQPLSPTRIAAHYRASSTYLPFIWRH